MKVHSWGEELTVHSLEEEVGLLDGILVAVALHHTLKNNKHKVLIIKRHTFFVFFLGGGGGCLYKGQSQFFLRKDKGRGVRDFNTPKSHIFLS